MFDKDVNNLPHVREARTEDETDLELQKQIHFIFIANYVSVAVIYYLDKFSPRKMKSINLEDDLNTQSYVKPVKH